MKVKKKKVMYKILMQSCDYGTRKMDRLVVKVEKKTGDTRKISQKTFQRTVIMT